MLFARNVEEPAQVAELAYEIAQLQPDLPLWVAVDQEGGRVARLRRPFTEWPPMGTLGRSGDLALAGRFACALAAELSAVGITLDFAPVLDVLTNPSNPVIGDRALSGEPDEVARLGEVVIARIAGGRHRGLRQALSGARRHQRRLAPRAAARRASSRATPRT